MKKKILLIACVLGIVSLSAFSLIKIKHLHGHHDPEKMAEHMTEVMTEKLSLNAEQQVKVKEMNLNFAKEMMQLHQSKKENHEEMIGEIMTLMMDMHENLEEVLTEDQTVLLHEAADEIHGHLFHMHMAHGGEMSKMHEEMKEKVLPFAIKEREAFDNNLSSEDKATIELFRVKFQEKKAEMKEHHPAHFDHENMTKEDMKEMHELMKGKHEEMKEKIQPIISIVNKHEKTLKKALKNVHEEAGIKHPHHMHHKHHDMMFNMAAVHFLLLDPSQDINEVQKNEIKLYPNPAKDVVTVTYEMTEKSPVKIDLLDKNGNTIKTVFEGTLDAGKQEFKIDLTQESDTGIYMVSITTSKGQQTEKVILQK